MLWVDRYRPKSLDTLITNKEVGANLKNLVAEGDCPHLLFYGPSGAGKKTLILALLREIFGPGAEKLKPETKEWKIERPTMSSNISVELTTLSSMHHIELNPSDAGLKDKYIVQEVIKETAKYRQLDMAGSKGFKVIVLNEVDRLTRDAQYGLRRTMEKYASVCRLILCCNNISKVTEAVRSRCLCIRVPAPDDNQICTVLEHVAKKEGLSLPTELAARIALQSDGNMRKALLSMEACKVNQYPFQPTQVVQAMDWELYIKEICDDIMSEQSPKRLYEVRQKLYELLINCIPPELILKTLLAHLMGKLDSELKHEVCHWAAHYEHSLTCGSKAIIHLEAFVAKFMSLYKHFVISMFG
uniref:AAA+ ATPase domain-containing protein n=1 Tax=Pyramimonas obovata TaxID=1411642 RepID=A0A7S0RPL9_9CHLO|mmetsp:Transcript_38819/g.84488  ORF Transcript_38819/g.84488 Transcript_38819/m.84488 type:complete len:357 (+) Transcript_38819:241-1311(+)|eukprot:CAMPEP_0118929818 /NCGR_PEP_ID=MMETSP1169-20130426/6707_1 /TAXON_ID=36882 /ORGANISM="Pyramimonas obovata, Strain CCMP722" /LENGTH=356 /DNA_ID=CAMNT_0006872073 /DNA_START=178 /DNA_END=1248 /DNA_ORIENTATION=+